MPTDKRELLASLNKLHYKVSGATKRQVVFVATGRPTWKITYKKEEDNAGN